jgi:hypothetical protein
MKIRPVGAEWFHPDGQTHDYANSRFFAILRTPLKIKVIITEYFKQLMRCKIKIQYYLHKSLEWIIYSSNRGTRVFSNAPRYCGRLQRRCERWQKSLLRKTGTRKAEDSCTTFIYHEESWLYYRQKQEMIFFKVSGPDPRPILPPVQ